MRGRRVVKDEVEEPAIDKRTAAKLKTMAKIFATCGIDRPSTVEELNRFKEWKNNNIQYLCTNFYYDFVTYARCILNPDYSVSAMQDHFEATAWRTWDRDNRCTCKMCKDCYNPKGFREFNDANYEAYLKIHGLY
jgi:hypothetical protein